MTFHRSEFTLSSSRKEELLDVSSQLAQAVGESGIDHGIACLYVTHATAALIINENWDPNICTDLLNLLDRHIPQGAWLHDRVDGNGAAHLKAAICGPSETVPVEAGKPVLGTWQSPMIADFDGPKSRRLVISVMGE